MSPPANRHCLKFPVVDDAALSLSQNEPLPMTGPPSLAEPQSQNEPSFQNEPISTGCEASLSLSPTQSSVQGKLFHNWYFVKLDVKLLCMMKIGCGKSLVCKCIQQILSSFMFYYKYYQNVFPSTDGVSALLDYCCCRDL